MKNLHCIVIIVILILIFTISSVYAELFLEVNQNAFTPGETISVRGYVKNNGSSQEVFDVSEHFFSDKFAESPLFHNVTLEVNEMYFIRQDITVPKTLPSGKYHYAVTSVAEDGSISEQKRVDFTISGTLKTFDNLSLQTFSNSACTIPKSVFLRSAGRIYLKAFDTENAYLTGKVTLPKASTVKIYFSNNIAQIAITQLGNYAIDIIASRAGYQDYAKNLEFEVVNSLHIYENRTNLCNVNGICDQGENIQNCPQDCSISAPDTTPPATTVSGIPTSLTTQLVTITLTATDTASGVKETYYSTNVAFEPNIRYTGPFMLYRPGTYTIKFYSVDNAGNREQTKTASRQVIINAPIIKVAIKPVTTPTTTNSQTISGTRTQSASTVIVTCPTATVGTVKYPTATTWLCLITNFKVGANTITVQAKDAAGKVITSAATYITYTEESGG